MRRFLYPSYLKLPLRWPLSPTRITDQRQLIGIDSLAALLQLQLFRLYLRSYYLLLTRRSTLQLIAQIRRCAFNSQGVGGWVPEDALAHQHGVEIDAHPAAATGKLG